MFFLICEFQNLLPVFWLPQYWSDETALPRSQSHRHLLRIRNSETVHPPSNLDYDPDETGSTPSRFFQPSARKILPPLLWLFCFLFSEKYCRCFFGSLYYDCHFLIGTAPQLCHQLISGQFFLLFQDFPCELSLSGVLVLMRIISSTRALHLSTASRISSRSDTFSSAVRSFFSLSRLTSTRC